MRRYPNPLLTALAVALVATASAVLLPAHAAEATFSFVDTGAHRDFVLSDDEVYVRWLAGAPANVRGEVESRVPGTRVIVATDNRALVKLSERPDTAKLRSGTHPLNVAFPGAQVSPVLYQAGLVRGNGTRRVFTAKLLVGVGAGQTPEQIGAIVGAVSARMSAKPGVGILELPSSYHVLDAVAVLQKAGVPVNPLLGHAWKAMAVPKDQFFVDQWHLLNTGQSGSAFTIDANVLDAWQVTLGANVTIGIVDSCLQTGHADLAPNTPTVNSGLHFDFLDDDTDPNPHFGDNHGTSVAGVAAAKQNNGAVDPVTGNLLGVTGAGPDARLIGLRLINESGFVPVTDDEEASALFWKPNGVDPIIDISNNSWGPRTEFAGLVGPDILTLTALKDSVELGRGGKGQITLFAAGNGQLGGSEVNLNGYGNSRYVIAVGAINNFGKQSFYSELGACVLVSAPSNGGTLGIVTSDNQDVSGYNPPNPLFGVSDLPNTDYTNSFGGTSSATPLVAGVTALLLSANPDLGWRDVKEILASTARLVDSADPGWKNNGAGFKFNNKYGGGMVDASAAVIRSLDWTNLNQELAQEAVFPSTQLPLLIPDGNLTGLNMNFNFTGPNYPNLRVETVEVTVNIEHGRRSDLTLSLISPDGTESVLAQSPVPLGSNRDYKYAVFTGTGIATLDQGWTFSSVRHWGENSVGTWRLVTKDRLTGQTGKILSASVRLFGTASPVQRFKFEKARYSDSSTIEPDNAPGAAPRELKINVLRIGPPVGTVSVDFVTSVRGTAKAAAEGVTDADYLPVGGTILFGNNETTKEITVPILHDDIAEATESIYLLLKNPLGATLGGVNVATIDLLDNDENLVTVLALDNEATEPSEATPLNPGVFTISRTVSSALPLLVSYTIGGTATPGLGLGDDYVPIEFTATIPANETSTTVTITPRDDESIEGVETVELTLIPDAGYRLGVPSSAQVRIIDNDRPDVQITIEANNVLLENDQTRIATVRLTRTDDNSLPLIVNLGYGGNQINGAQYEDADALPEQTNRALPDQVIFASGQSTLDLHIRTVNDAVYQASKQIEISLQQSENYNFNFGFLSTVTLTVIEDDPLPDSKIPTLKVTEPKQDARFVSPATVTVKGTASDNTEVSAVEYSINKGSWKAVPGVTPGTSVSWSLLLNPPDHPTAPEIVYGENVVEVRSIDNDRNRSLTGVSRFKFVLEQPLTVNVDGGGSVSTGFAGQSTREVGTVYTISAKAASGQVFKGWTGLRADFPNPTARTISFTLADLVSGTLGAEFIASPFGPVIAGTYSGLARDVAFVYESSGYVTVKVGSLGAFSGKLLLGGVSYTLKGEFSGTGVFIGTIPRKNNLPLEVNLMIDLDPAGSQRVTGTIKSSTFNLLTLADRAPFSRTTPPPAAVADKMFTLWLPPNDPVSNPQFDPHGNGHGTVKIDAAGTVKVSGVLGDGSKFSLSQALTKDLTWPFFLEPYGKKGVAIGLVTQDATQPDSDFHGSFNWFKPSLPKDKYFPFGFQIQGNDILGSLYTFQGGRALPGFAETADNALITVIEGNIVNPILKVGTLATSNVVTINEEASVSKGEGLSIKINAKAGTFNGSFLHPVSLKKNTVNGVLFQKQNKAVGGFQGTSISGVPLQTGKVTLEPRP